jgi:hypothetical protein
MMLGVKLSRVGEAPASSTASNSSSTAASVETAAETTTEDAATKAEEAVSTGSKILKGLGGLFKK